jgi:hypothetical protein
MRRISSNFVGILQGHVALFDHYSEKTPMWEGTGPRHVRVAVAFEEPFLDPPTVTVAISMIDKGNETPLRLALDAREVSEKGFVAEARTWGDTRIARLSLDWTSIGATSDPDEAWDV